MTRKDIPILHPIHPWHQRYMSLTQDLPLPEVLETHRQLFAAEEKSMLEQLGNQTYIPGKWTIRDILQHMIDTERILNYRALCIARNSAIPLPGFEEAEYGRFTTALERTIESLLGEFDLVRQASIALFSSFDELMLKRTGLCSDIKISVLALGFVIAGHPLHHLRIIREHYFPILQQSEIKIVTDKAEYLPYFETLNRAWIEQSYELEADDLYVLGRPQNAILEPGGSILFAEKEGKVIGTVALQRVSNIEYELIKMAVDEGHRGRGTGQRLIQAAIEKARELGATRITLHSNTESNAKAVSLYKYLGFLEVPLGECRYERANIKMQLNLQP
ncbi:GNAT superfamily N-acetyltransferase [Pedobacter sp. AK017]|uniref:GNAT family N-acetyltransferase n=1 Tax=Pedobacter sp. AK017 TaxID=2723073 RepID=UPI001840FE1A|nr:GNAT family N-acetyltransferase [Pedobacter sp. AK017]MBB5438337.1 GNAT superfamily N-acetyltransferase [Pedobacter sp. AK017]